MRCQQLDLGDITSFEAAASGEISWTVNVGKRRTSQELWLEIHAVEVVDGLIVVGLDLSLW
jgi:hypothetical protein